MIFSPFGLCMLLHIFVEGNVAFKHGGEDIFCVLHFRLDMCCLNCIGIAYRPLRCILDLQLWLKRAFEKN